MVIKSTEIAVKEYLRKKGNGLFHREGQELEFKEQFNFAGLAEYLRDFAAFANNRGGYLIFGVEDSPRKPTGLSESAADQFDKIDPEMISGFILDIFSRDISWCHGVIELYGNKFGYFRIFECTAKPVMAKKTEGRDQEIKNGEIYYRYGGRSQKIQHAELENIINARIDQINKNWLDLMGRIARIGPQNAAVLDSESGLIEKGPDQVMVIEEELARKIKFIKEGYFTEREGATTLKLVGDVVPVDRIEVIKKVKEHLTKSYPLSATELAEEVIKQIPSAKQNDVWTVIKENGLKENTDYSAYNFRNKKQEDQFKKTGVIPPVTPSIYNSKAIEFIVNILEGKIAQQKTQPVSSHIGSPDAASQG
jgi:hypothetical protein